MANYYYYRTTPLECGSASKEQSGPGLARETELVLRHCEHSGWAAPATFCDEGVEWTRDVAARDQAGKLLEAMQEGDILIIHAIQRMFSSCQDTLAVINLLAERGVRLFVIELGGFVTDRRFSRDLLGLLAIFADLERRRAAERIKQVKQKQRARGRYLGGSRPFGYMIHENGRLLENPLEQRVLKKILAMKQQGRSLRAIAAEVSTPMAPISFKTVQRVLQRHAE